MTVSQAALIQLKQTARCGLRSELTAPALLCALDRLIPSDYAAIAWQAEDGSPSHLYVDKPLDAAGFGRLAEVIFRAHGLPGHPADAAPPEDGSGLQWLSVHTGFADYEVYRSIFGPHDIREVLRCAVGTRETGRAALCLYRSTRMAGFSGEERRFLEELLPWFGMAWQGKGLPERWETSDEDGYLVTDEVGRLLHASCRGRHWWHLATVDYLPGAVFRLAPQVSLRTLLQRHTAAPPDGAVPPLEVDNLWGRFTLRSVWLDESLDESGRRLLVRIVRQVPAEIRIIERLADLPLSYRQKELCCLLARGLSYPEAAAVMGVQRSTVADYADVIYKRLEVRGRDDLLLKLAGGAALS
jgi:DNA-binding CsgD family transcriptional regulator